LPESILIILYGDFSKSKNPKQQRMINGKATCGYREYARNFGKIIYLAPQEVRQPWEHSICKPENVIKLISQYPNSIIWSVKYSFKKDQMVLSKIKNKKIYYSCNSKNLYNNFCDVSLVDTKERLKGNAKIWFKGKDPEYWIIGNPIKEFDYLLIGHRADKNELYFLRSLNEIKEKRRILWIGGKKHQSKIKTKHEVVCTDFIGPDEVRKLIPTAKVGILFTELKVEGFPQAFLEMTMCGVPVIYNVNGPRNKFYFHTNNCILCNKAKLIKSAENLLRNYDPIKCRKDAIDNYSIKKSYQRIIECLK
jgi:hypothetical protein